MSLCTELFMFLLTINIFYLIYKWEKSRKPSQFHQLRNQYQQLIYPDLHIHGYGDLYISFTYKGQDVVYYYTSVRKHRHAFDQFRKKPEVKNLEEGVILESDWKKRWGK